jgi:hypothetical protein
MSDSKSPSAPGEVLATRLLEMLDQKGFARFFKGKRDPRMMLEYAQSLRRVALIAAQTEREAEQIRSGERSLEEVDVTVQFRQLGSAKTLSNDPNIAGLDPGAIDFFARVQFAETVRVEANTAVAIAHAVERLEEDPSPPPEKDIDDDWFHRWRSAAGETSKENLQQLWGQLLAGEFKAPGTFSLRTMEFLRNITSEEAVVVKRILNLAIDGEFIWKPDFSGDLSKFGITFDDSLAAQEMGVITVADGFGLSRNYTGGPDGIKAALRSHELAIKYDNSTPGVEKSFAVLGINRLGRELLKLGTFEANRPYLVAFGKSLIEANTNVRLGRCVDRDGRTYLDGAELLVADS